MNNETLYDVAIIGGGIAGLSCAILVARAGYAVILFEKEKYPFHKVCWEYVSMESFEFLQNLGIGEIISGMPKISKLIVSAPNGKRLMQDLKPGGIGISRYLLDESLMQEAVRSGVTVKEQVKVHDIHFVDKKFFITINDNQKIQSTIALGTFGKRSNIDLKWKRPFSLAEKNKRHNYIGIKYHVKTNFPDDSIALHNFENGYCGISKIENEMYNLCYLTTAGNLQKWKGDIHQMEKHILYRNPHLKTIFENSTFLHSKPVVISQIRFDKKSQVENHVLLIGDAAGMITPLCGNGMSMALQGSALAVKSILEFLDKKITRSEMEKNYKNQWQQTFSGRLKVGRRIQSFFGNRVLSNFMVSMLNPFPSLVKYCIQKTHGESF